MGENKDEENTKVGDGTMVAEPNEHYSMELCQGLGSSPAVCMLTEEVKGKNPTLVFLVEMKATMENERFPTEVRIYTRDYSP